MIIFDKSLSVLDNDASDTSARTDAVDELRDIAEGSKAAALRNMAQNTLSSRQL